jgi:hypothetical protein
MRGALLLGRNGYVLQAWGVGASVLEHAWTLGYALSSPDRSTAWLGHEKMRAGPWRVREALRETLKTRGIPEREVEYHKNYERLCAAKHGNPTLQRRYSSRRKTDALQVEFDPYLHTGLVRALRYGMASALQGVGLGLWSYVDTFDVPRRVGNATAHFAKDVHEVLRAARDLNTDAT